MAGIYGLSFQPGTDHERGSGGRATPIQEAVRLLSLRLPTVTGARGIAPMGLLNSPGSAGVNTGGFTLDAAMELLRKIRGLDSVPQLQSTLPAPASPQSAPWAVPQTSATSPRPSNSPTPRTQPPRPSGQTPTAPSVPPRVIPGDLRPTPTIEFPPESTPRTPPEVISLPDLPEPTPVRNEPTPYEQHGGHVFRPFYDDDDEYHRG